LHPLLTDGLSERCLPRALKIKRLYATTLISGEWTGTMNLTEPRAGSDLAMVRTRAGPPGDGSYKFFGTTIPITFANTAWRATSSACAAAHARRAVGRQRHVVVSRAEVCGRRQCRARRTQRRALHIYQTLGEDQREADRLSYNTATTAA
jgi:hypothetical protein